MHCKGKLGEKGPKPWLMKRGLFKVLFHANIQNIRTKSIWVSKRREKERICVIERKKIREIKRHKEKLEKERKDERYNMF